MSSRSKKTQYSVALGGSSWLFWMVFAGILGFFVYNQTVAGMFGAILIAFIVSIVSAVGLIPILGPVLYWYWLAPSAVNWGLQLAGLQATWLTNVFMQIGLLFAILLTIIAGFIAFIFLFPRRMI